MAFAEGREVASHEILLAPPAIAAGPPFTGGELPLNFHPDWFFADALAALAGHASAASVGRGCRR